MSRDFEQNDICCHKPYAIVYYTILNNNNNNIQGLKRVLK